MQVLKYTIVLSPEPGEVDVYNITVPALPEIATFGESLAEARYMAQDAIELSLLSRFEEGETIPKNKKPSKLPAGTKSEEILVTVDHQVKTQPLTADVKLAFS